MHFANQTRQQIHQALNATGYIATEQIITTLFLADKLQKPILVEGPAGIGKTSLAKSVAQASNTQLIRLQCYEGLDESKLIYEWQYAKQILYTQLLREKTSALIAQTNSLSEAINTIASHDDAFFSEHFLQPRPILAAILADKPVILLIDEIDRAEEELEAFLLEVLAEFQVTIPELGTLTAKHRPLVILTSNNTRELSDALLRRCLYLDMDYPSVEQELIIVRTHAPHLSKELSEQVVKFVDKARSFNLKKKPSIAETIDWALALEAMNIQHISESKDTLNLLFKHHSDKSQGDAAFNEFIAVK